MFNRKLIKNNGISEDQRKEFREVVKKQITIVELSSFKKFILSIPNIFLIIFLFILGPGIFLLLLTSTPDIESLSSIFWMLVAIAIGPILAIVDITKIFKYKKEFKQKALMDFDWHEIASKWFSFYGIDSKDVSHGSIFGQNKHSQIIDDLREAPSDAFICRHGANITVKINGINNTFHNVKWKWFRTISDGEKSITKTFYLDQFFIIQEGFAKKWENLMFLLEAKPQILNKKQETLENDAFNQKFSYKYNDPVKLRMAFTPYTQEYLVDNWRNYGVFIKKYRNYLTTMVKNKNISYSFSPFTIDIGNVKTNKQILKRVLRDMESDFPQLMKLMGYPYMIESMFKKGAN